MCHVCFFLLEHRFIILDRRHSYLNPAWFPRNIWRDELRAKHFRVCSFRTNRAKTLHTANRLKQTPCRERDKQHPSYQHRELQPSARPSNTSVAQQYGSACVWKGVGLCTESGLSCEKVRGAREAPAGISLSEDREHSLLGFSRYREMNVMGTRRSAAGGKESH